MRRGLISPSLARGNDFSHPEDDQMLNSSDTMVFATSRSLDHIVSSPTSPRRLASDKGYSCTSPRVDSARGPTAWPRLATGAPYSLITRFHFQPHPPPCKPFWRWRDLRLAHPRRLANRLACLAPSGTAWHGGAWRIERLDCRPQRRPGNSPRPQGQRGVRRARPVACIVSPNLLPLMPSACSRAVAGAARSAPPLAIY